VWKADSKQCFLKSDYDENKNTIDCIHCVAYAEGGAHYLYHRQTVAARALGNYTTWPHEGGIWMPKYVAQQLCRVTTGYDQPEEYNLGEPIAVQHSYQCCNECAKLPGECKSWVYKSKTHECFLKNAFGWGESKVDCEDCVAYDASSLHYVYQKSATIVRKYIFTFTTDVTTWKQSSFGSGGGWSTTTATTTNVCTFAVGFDQPADFNLGEPLVLDAAYKCCNSCNENDQCESWVWKADTHQCLCTVCCLR